jgi:transposase
MIHQEKAMCSEKKTGFPLVFNTRKGAWSRQVAATSLVKPNAIPFGRLHFIDTAYSEHIANKITMGISIMKIKKKSKIKNNKLPLHLQHININAAGIDIGSESHFVAVPEGRDKESVREFSSFTCDLHNIASWLKKCKVDTIAMESTGVYWIPLYDHLESEGFEVKLVNARHVKNVSGRKTDVLDCQWLQQLHTYGLLAGAFRPSEDICVMRSLHRHRSNLVRFVSSHVLHMQKALSLMNLRLHNVISDITGVTGMRIIHAIVGGERDPLKLAEFRDVRCKNDYQTIVKSLEGNYRSEHVFALKQALELYEYYQTKISECDQEIEKTLQSFKRVIDIKENPLEGKRKTAGKNQPKFDVRSLLYEKSGVDLTRIDGINESSALTILSEIGFSVAPWKTSKHFASWLGLSPGNKISGGKSISSKTKLCANKVAAALRLAATNLWRSQTALGAYYRRMSSRIGKPGAVTATAHKLARLVYSMLKNGTEYVDKGVEHYEMQYKQRIIKNMKNRAKQFGLKLVEAADAAGTDIAVPSTILI